MGKYSEEELDRMAGTQQNKPYPKLEIADLRFKGKDKKYVLSKRPENWEKGMKYEETDLGEAVEIVILRVKKFLQNQDENYITDEYDSPKDIIDLKQQGINAVGKWESKFIDSGIPLQMKERYGLKAGAYVYCLLNGELVKLQVNGTSLFSNDYKDAQLLYNYAGTFNHTEGERAYKFMTIGKAYGPLKAKKGGDYYIQSFERSRPLTEDEMDLVGDNMFKVDEFFKELAEYKAQFSREEKQPEVDHTETQFEEDLPTIQQEEDPVPDEFPKTTKSDEDINVDDIPF